MIQFDHLYIGCARSHHDKGQKKYIYTLSAPFLSLTSSLSHLSRAAPNRSFLPTFQPCFNFHPPSFPLRWSAFQRHSCSPLPSLVHRLHPFTLSASLKSSLI